MAAIIDYEHGICSVDSGLIRPQQTAIHFIVERGRVAVVDAGTNDSVPVVIEALRDKGLAPEDVDYLILTHIHLDHAGGAGLLMRQLPNARLTVHPRGARHMIDPAKLIESTIAVYGEEAARRLYGNILPVPKERIVETPHEASIRLAGRELAFYDTPGHARHQVCVRDSKSGHLFAGDTFGLSYREIDMNSRQFVFPTTSPVQWDPEAHHRSVDLMLGFKPAAIYVTHYGQVRDVPRLGADLHRLVDAHHGLAFKEKDAGPERYERLKTGVTQLVLGEAGRHGWRLPREKILEVLGMDIDLNALGLAAWLDSNPAR